MLNSITGIVSHIGENEVFIDTGALEYIVFTPDPLANNFELDIETKVYLFLNHREDRMELYGFKDLKQRELFLKLITVSGFGPKQSLKVLSKTSPDNFIKLLNSEDASALATLPGIGKVTASKIILALRGKLTFADDDDKIKEDRDEIADALVEMGFDKKAAYSCVASLRKSLKDITPAENLDRDILKQAIIRLNSR